ncbi:hypothetical protein ABBQ38_006242 [Trebouxia sp. C0009 RCD-2024]
MVVALVVLAAIGVMAYKLHHEFKMPPGLQLIPYKDLGLTCYSKILGQGRHGLVLQAEYSSMSTAVKLLLAPLQATAPAPFCPRGPPVRGWSISSEETLPPSPRTSSGRLLYDGTKTNVHPGGAHQLCRWSSLLRCPSIWLLVTAAFMQAVRAPTYIIPTSSGSHVALFPWGTDQAGLPRFHHLAVSITVILPKEHLEISGSYRWLHFRTGRCSQDALTLTAVEILAHCNNAHLPGCHQRANPAALQVIIFKM